MPFRIAEIPVCGVPFVKSFCPVGDGSGILVVVFRPSEKKFKQ